MKKFYLIQYVLLIFFSILACVFFVSYIWEFHLEELVFLNHREEDDGERWEYVFTSTTFAFISLLPATWLSWSLFNRLYKSNEKIQMADYALLNTKGAVLMTSPSLEIIFVNTSFSNLTGLSKKQLIGRSPSDFCHHSENSFFSVLVWSDLDEGKSWQGELDRDDDSEQQYHVKADINQIRNNEGIILGYVALISDVTDLKNEEKKLHLLAHYDYLTKLPNRLLLEARFEHSVQLAQRNNTKLGLLFLDIDHFKMLNDKYGHYFADKLLQELALRLNASIRDQDTVARVGGDEFIIVVHEVSSPSSLDTVIDKINALIALPYCIDGREVNMGVSIGVSLYPDEGGTLGLLAKSADLEMYKAKNVKSNRARI